ncbi:MAG: hypothetical protein M3R10_00425, partial [Verrucomicrobiota bacterium]|nr:hypothetical protein [Verrucomicrobiota bacterium]
MRQVWFTILVCIFFFATGLFAEEARRAELVNPPKKSPSDVPARALPVTAADKKEAVVKKDRPSIEIDLGAKKETNQSPKKEVAATDKKETSFVTKKDVAQV